MNGMRKRKERTDRMTGSKEDKDEEGNILSKWLEGNRRRDDTIMGNH